MAAPTSENEVTARRLSSVITGTWEKVKELAVSDVAWDSTNGKLTETKNGTTTDIVTSGALQTALTGSIASGNTGFVTGGAAYTALGNKANLASPTFTGTPNAPTAAAGTNTTQIATTAFVKAAVDTAIAGISGDLTYKGTYAGGSASGYGALTPAADKGDVYKVSTAGKLDGVAVEVGDMLICNTTTAAATSTDYATVAAKWDFIQANIDGAVTGPSSSVNNRVAVFDGTTGKVIKDSGYTIAKSVPSDAVFTDTDTKVTAVGNHYTPSGGTSKSASGGAASELPTSSSGSLVQVLTGVTVDAAGHVTGVSSKGLWSPNTTYESKSEAAGGTAVSLCTTGEKYTWNNKQDLILDLNDIRTQASGAVRYDTAQNLSSTQKTQARSNIGAGTSNLTIGTSSSTAAAGNHTHTTSLATDTGTSTVDLAHNTTYKLTAGGTSVIFKTPTAPAAANNGSLKIGLNGGTATSKFTANQSTDSTLTFATGSTNGTIAVDGTNVAVKGLGTAAYTASGAYAPSGHTHDLSIAADSGTSSLAMTANTKYKLTAGGKTYVFTTPPDTNTTYNFDGTYDASTNKAATVSSITSRIGALDVTVSGMGAGKTLESLTETDGKIAATFQDITITKSQVSDFPSSMTPTSHTHGNITNDGKLSDTAAAAAGNDYVVIRDADNNKIQTSTIKGTDVASAVSNKHTHSTLTLSTTAQAYDGTHTLALPSTDPYTSARTPSSHSHGNITNAGAIGSTSGYAVYTTTNGVLTAGTLETSSPSASGNTLAFIDTVSQDAKGKITATKKSVTIDSSLSSTSTNPVQNKVINTALAGKQNTLTEMTTTEVDDLLAALT